MVSSDSGPGKANNPVWSNDGQRILVNELPPTEQNMIGAKLIQNWMSALVQ